MGYALLDVELSEPASPVRLGADQNGLALIVRWHGRPCGFLIQPLAPGSVLDGEAAHRLAEEARAEEAERNRGLAAPARPEASRAAPRPLPPLTVAVCTRDRPRALARLLGSLPALAPPAGPAPPLELLVVDNAPPDDATRAVVEAFAATAPALAGRALDVRYLVEPKPGLDFARNRALAEARGALIAYLDDDVVVEPDWLAGLAEAYADHPDAAAFTGLVLPLALDTEAQVIFERRGGFRKGFVRRRFGPELPGDPTYPCRASLFGTGANMALRTDVARALGGFDEALDMGAVLPGGGDVDMFYRIVRSGHPLVYEPSFAVRHEHRRDRAGLRRQYQRSWGTGTTAFAMKIHREDPAMRPQIRRYLRSWFGYQLRLVRAGVTRRGVLPLDMALAELWGGFIGLYGRYERAERLAARIRADHEP